MMFAVFHCCLINLVREIVDIFISSMLVQRWYVDAHISTDYQRGPNISFLSWKQFVLIWVQNVCKGYQQGSNVVASKEFVKRTDSYVVLEERANICVQLKLQ